MSAALLGVRRRRDGPPSGADHGAAGARTPDRAREGDARGAARGPLLKLRDRSSARFSSVEAIAPLYTFTRDPRGEGEEPMPAATAP